MYRIISNLTTSIKTKRESKRRALPLAPLYSVKLPKIDAALWISSRASEVRGKVLAAGENGVGAQQCTHVNSCCRNRRRRRVEEVGPLRSCSAAQEGLRNQEEVV
jgi:hypothetical protein